MSEDHGRLDDEVPDGAVNPVVDIASADSGEFDGDEDIVWAFEGGYGTVFKGDFVGFLEDEGEVLKC